jgi:hypothetical protein
MTDPGTNEATGTEATDEVLDLQTVSEELNLVPDRPRSSDESSRSDAAEEDPNAPEDRVPDVLVGDDLTLEIEEESDSDSLHEQHVLGVERARCAKFTVNAAACLGGAVLTVAGMGIGALFGHTMGVLAGMGAGGVATVGLVVTVQVLKHRKVLKFL